MGAEQDQARRMAERIARRVSGGTSAIGNRAQQNSEVSAELAEVRAGLSELQRKISKLERAVTYSPNQSSGAIGANTPAQYQQAQPNQALSTHSPWLAGINSSYSHPSQEQFGVEEATVTELVDFFEKEKQCTIEPGGKPCDHCAMCSSRGF